MKRLLIIALAALLLAGILVVAWTVAGLPPVRMVVRYGFDYGPEPTGRTLTVEGVEFVEIGPGCFLMGSDLNGEPGDFLGGLCYPFGLPWGEQPEPSDEMPVHWVEFSRGFWVAKTEVTNEQYEAFDPKHKRNYSSLGDQDPVVDVSLEDAKKYCVWLSERSGFPMRIPSESEWECSCRAGSKREYCSGDDEERLDEYAWNGWNSDDKAHAVGTRRANAWGLHDFHGNVWEWCEDTYHLNYDGAPSDGMAWTESGILWSGEPIHVNRGGCFGAMGKDCRSANRDWNGSGMRYLSVGFRPAFTLPLKNE